MGSMELVIIEGNVGRVEEQKTLPSGSVVTNFTVAVSTPGRRNDDGTRGEGTTKWFKCAAWNNGNQKNADVITNFVKVGNQILLTGTIKADAYLKDGEPVGTLEFTVGQITLLGSAAQNGAPAATPDTPLSDIPF